ncbi:hypothetical protein HOLleu_20331 [Holothuria leucospilota]|uniref:Uncharacterized protein n=1 Tax=Holothuria leucospilota TaxID=206669 RepID=A0A9Q1BZP9_HOLLE|nr:hypothetical protein HOLleu_20331 [Holothuria leucospilota]
MCGRNGDSSPAEDTRTVTTRRTTRATTTTTTRAPTTTLGTTQKPNDFTYPASKYTASSSLNRKATVSSARDGGPMIEFGLIGAVIGGLLLLLVVALLFFFIYRQRRSKTLKDGSRKKDTVDSNVNGESGLTVTMTSLPNYDEEQHDENVKPLYTQVNKKRTDEGPQNTLETHLQNGNKALNATTVIETSRDTEKSKGNEDTEEMVDNMLYESDSAAPSIVHEKPLKDEIPQTNGNRLGNTETTLNKVQSRVTYENVESTTESNTYENQTDRQPESDWGSAYDKLERLDHVIGNQKVIGENVYDM